MHQAREDSFLILVFTSQIAVAHAITGVQNPLQIFACYFSPIGIMEMRFTGASASACATLFRCCLKTPKNAVSGPKIAVSTRSFGVYRY